MKNILTLSTESTFDDAIRFLDQNGNGILPVVDKKGVLIGIITDGDVRRAILDKELTLKRIINKNPICLKAGTPKSEVINYLHRIHRRHMPIVDSNNRLIEVVILDDFEVRTKPNWVVVMAGGLGTRLGELTKETPKPMLPVGGKPILLQIIESFKHFGFSRFLICVNYKSDHIQNYFGNGEHHGVEIRFSEESKRLGTAGPISLIDQELIKMPFFVVNGDILTTCDFEDVMKIHLESQNDATMVVKEYEYKLQYANVHFDENNKLVDIQEKPAVVSYINSGVYILSPETIKMIPNNEFYDMPDLFKELIKKEFKVGIYKFNEYWLDIGHPTDYNQANLDLDVPRKEES